MRLIKIFAREYGVQYAEVSIRSLGFEVKKHIPKLVLSQVYIPEYDGNEGCYADQVEWDNFINLLNKKYLKPKELKSFLIKFYKYGEKYVNTAYKISKKNLAKIDNDILIKYYTDYQKNIIDYTAYLWLGFWISNTYSNKVREILENKNIKEINEVLDFVLTPSRLCGILKLQNKLIKLKKNGKKLSTNLVADLLTEYSWMPCLDIHNDPWTQKDLFNFFKNLKIPSHKNTNNKKILSKINLNKSELNFIQSAKELIYIKDMRDEYRRKGVYNSIALFEEMASRLGVSRKELAYFTQAEIIQALKNKIKLNKKTAKNRQGKFLIYWRDKKIYLTIVKKEIDNFIKINVLKDALKNNNQVNILKGTPASVGKARGGVKIVLGVKDLKKVKKGDIMVSITTHQDFISAMNLSSAIVTDEGGLTSHAAIVSRELKIPCVVGVKIATKVLKDGNVVEVDANKGVIKIV